LGLSIVLTDTGVILFPQASVTLGVLGAVATETQATVELPFAGTIGATLTTVLVKFWVQVAVQPFKVAV
jgi:hypothetical protein